MNYVIGIDIGGTNTKFGIVKNDGVIISSKKFSTKEYPDFNSFMEKLITEIDKMLIKSSLSINNVSGIGVGVPNGNYQTGFIENPTNLKFWGNQDIVTPLKKKFNTTVNLDNDANVAAIGEKFFGQAQRVDDFIVVTLGTGVGTGVFSNGSLVRGKNGLASEGGHIQIFSDERTCGCGGKGHLECYTSLTGIKLSAFELTNNQYRFREIVSLYHKGDLKINHVIDKVSFELAKGLSVMGCMFAPEKIILTGGVTLLGDSFVLKVQDFYNKLIYPPFKDTTNISISKISREKGALLGAAALIFNKLT